MALCLGDSRIARISSNRAMYLLTQSNSSISTAIFSCIHSCKSLSNGGDSQYPLINTCLIILLFYVINIPINYIKLGQFRLIVGITLLKVFIERIEIFSKKVLAEIL